MDYLEISLTRTLRRTNGISSVAFDGTTIVTGLSWDRTIKVWDVHTGECKKTLTGHTNYVFSVALQGTTIVSGSEDKTIKVWDMHTGECKKTLTGHTRSVMSVAFDGSTIVSGSNDYTIKVWDVHTGECKKTLTGHTNSVSSVAFDGTTIVSGSEDETVKVWDVHTGECKKTLTGHTNCVNSVAFKGTTIVSGSEDKTIKVWDVHTGECKKTLTGRFGWVKSVAFQGTTIVSGFDDGTIKVWDLHTGECKRTLTGHTNWVAVAFQGTTIVSGSHDGTIKVWSPKDPLKHESGNRKIPPAVGAALSLRSKYEAIRAERERLLDIFGDFNKIPVDAVGLVGDVGLTETFKSLFRIGKPDRAYDVSHPTESKSAYQDPFDNVSFDSQSPGATPDMEEIDLEPAKPPSTIREIRAANSAMVDRILDGPQDTFDFTGIGEIPIKLSKLQDVLGNIINQTEKMDIHPIVQWTGREGSLVGNYQIDPHLELAAYAPGKKYTDVTEMPIVLVCCVYSFNKNRAAHLFAIIIFNGRLYSFGFGYIDSDWSNSIKTIPLAMYNPDDIMNQPFYTGSGDSKDFRKVDVLNMFLLKREHIERLHAFVVRKNPSVRVETHKYVPVRKCNYVASTSEENNWLLHEDVNPGLAFNCAKVLAKMIFTEEMYCWGNSLATTIRSQALTEKDIAELSILEASYYTKLKEWKKIKTRMIPDMGQNKLKTRIIPDMGEFYGNLKNEIPNGDGMKKVLDRLKEEMNYIKHEAKKLIKPHMFEWGLEVLEEFETLYSAKGSEPSEIVSSVSEFLTRIQSPTVAALLPRTPESVKMDTHDVDSKKRKSRKNLTRTKHSKTKRHKSNQKTHKKRTKNVTRGYAIPSA